MSKGWFGFDLDSTIAFYETWGDGSIGAPIRPMIRRMKHYLRTGRKIAIVTARVHPSKSLEALEQRHKVRDFLNAQFGKDASDTIDIRCDKDPHMIALFDDRAEQVIPNKGILVREELRRAVEALERIAQSGLHSAFVAQEALDSLDQWSRDLTVRK
jgi:hypothetical protein